MNEKEIGFLNKTLTIHFPIDELSVYMHGSELDDKAVPNLSKSLSMLGLKVDRIPEKIIYRSRWTVAGSDPDETISLLSIKRNNLNVDFSKLKRLYESNMLAKFLWQEYFLAENLSWRDLLLLCNRLVERSATDFNVFLRFSIMADGSLELITN